jgi:Mg2+-importing ATPase
LEICSEAELANGSHLGIGLLQAEIEQLWRKFSEQGCRVLAVAYRELEASVSQIDLENERNLVLVGFILLSDPPKPGIEQILQELAGLGVQVKIVTGDNHLVARHLAQQVGLRAARVLSGPEIHAMSDGALMRQALDVDVFAEIEPTQKERLVLALKKSGQVVGYIGDGINDVSALHAADASLSVEGAVDVAREAADFVLLARDLGVLVDGIREGRRTFANTLKYVFIATSANFGNMFSMAGASLFLPFLPLLPKQILLLNLLTDLPEMTIAGDNVDDEMTHRPRRWDISLIRRFMTVFGLISSLFDYLTFGLLFWLNANMLQFRTGWFIESIVSAALIVLVIRTRHSIFRSRPNRFLFGATIGVILIAIGIPHSPFANALGFRALPAHFYPFLGLIVLGYVLTAEIAKRAFYRRSPGNGQS